MSSARAGNARATTEIPAVQSNENSPLKHISVTSDDSVYLTLGGELRERFEYYSEPFFGLRDVKADSYLLHRLLLSADLHAGDYMRVFVELGNYLEGGKTAPRSPTDVNEFDLQQGFVDLTIPFDARSKLMLRAGRQQMSFGSGRLVSLREGANIRRSFDGARVTLTAGKATFDAFAVRTVNLKVGALNDDPNRDEAFWGFYGVLPLPALLDGHVDLYYLGLSRDDAVFQQGVADELRHSFGTRLWGKPDAWDYNYEALVQTGSFGDADILAWTVATDTGYTLKSAPLRPRIGLKADIASGDGNPNNDRLTTFNALFPKQPYFTEASLIAPANIIDVHPSLSFQLSKNVELTTDVDFFWKHRVEDAIYAPPGRPLIPAGQSESRYVGCQTNAELEWKLDRNSSLTLYYSHFFSGPAVTDGGGRDVDFFGTWIAMQF
ncbi:MAG: alginate export family protein [Verrucomicrobiota bacterium]|nr:alginate export family protein [Verrucomicrobiota bacterium]